MKAKKPTDPALAHIDERLIALLPDEEVTAASGLVDPATIAAFTDRFDELVVTPLADIVAWLTADDLLALLQKTKRAQWTTFLQDLRSPARSLSVNVAERALVVLRRKSAAQQERFLSWLITPIARSTTSLSGDSLPDSTREFSDLQINTCDADPFDDAINIWGPATIALAVCVRWDHPGRPARLAYLLADGNAVPPNWPADDAQLITARDNLIAALDDVFAAMIPDLHEAIEEDHGGPPDPDELAGADEPEAAGIDADRTVAGSVGRGPIPTSEAHPVTTAAHMAPSERRPSPSAPNHPALRLVLAASDPHEARATAAARRATTTDDTANHGEADLWDTLASVGELADTLPSLALIAAAATSPMFHAIPEHETAALNAALTSSTGETLAVALHAVISAKRDGRDGEFIQAIAALTTHPSAATIPTTITAAMSGTLTSSPPTDPDPIIEAVIDYHRTDSSRRNVRVEPNTEAVAVEPSVPDAQPAQETADTPATGPSPSEATVAEATVAEADVATTDDRGADVISDHADKSAAIAEQGAPATTTAGRATESDGPAADTDRTPEQANGLADVTIEVPAAAAHVAIGQNATDPQADNDATAADDDETDRDVGVVAISGDEASIGEVRRVLVRAGAWSAVAELDRRVGNQTATWDAAAIAEQLRTPYSPLVAEFTAVAGELDPRRVRDIAAQIVGIAASVRVAYIAPAAGAGVAASSLASVRNDRPGISGLAAAAQRADEMAWSYATESVGVAAGAAAWNAGMIALATEASEILNRAGRTTFERGSWIWESWVADGGELHNLLKPIADSDATAATTVRRLHKQLSTDKGVRELIATGDNKHRPTTNRSQIDGSARRTLQRWIAEAVAVAGRWVVTAEANPARTTATADRRADQLRTAFTEAWPQAERELRALVDGDDADLAAAAAASKQLLEPIVELVCRGIPLEGDEPTVDVALRGGLLRTTCHLRQDLTVADETIHVGDLEAAATITWTEAFEQRIGQGQFNLAAVIADEARRLGQPDAAELIERVRTEGDLAADLMRQTVAELEIELSEAQRFGRITADAAETLNAQLETARRVRRDLDQVAAEIAAIEGDLVGEAAAARERLAEFLAEHTGTAEYALVAERIERILDAHLPDLATAEDLLQRALDGEDVATRTTESVQSFDPAVMAAMAGGITPAVVAACAARASAPLDFSVLDESAAGAASEALDAWVKVASGPRHHEWKPVLGPVLRLLGLRGGSESRRKPSDADHQRFDLSNATRQGKALVPEFGSSTHGLYAFVLAWNRPSIDTLLTWVGQDAREAQATIVLYFGTLSSEQRCLLVNRLRKGSQRPLAVVDDAVVAHLARLGTNSFEDLMRATLPYAAVNPFFIGGGDVPVEMFYGRMDERRDVMENRDRTLIYGGRRLGKSALLRSAKARFEEGGPERRSVLVDLYNAGIGQHRRPAAVWDELLPALVTAGIASADRRRKEDPEKAAPRAIREWLDTDLDRRLLVLLDEADDFFDADAEFGFSQTAQFRDLKENYPGRFKVVFAGLHQVARFKHHHNQPFAQFVVDEAPIGPLPAGPAHDLLTRPLEALGWYFASPDLPARALHACNYIPILIQELGRSLVKLLTSRDLAPGAARTAITADDLEAVLRENKSRAKERIDVTLELDHRYKVIAWGVALGAMFSDGPMTTDALYDSCRSWWPEGFARTNFTEFRSLIDELVHLGILAARADAASGVRSWHLRSRNMQNLLGTTDEIETNLEHLVRDNPPVGSFFGTSTRRKIDQDGSASALSPLTEGQLTDVVGIGQNQVRLVIGTEATGVGRIGDAIGSVNKSLQDRCEMVPAKDLRMLRRALAADPDRHQVVIDDLVAKEVGRDGLRQTIRLILEKKPPIRGTRSVVIIIDPVQYADIADILAETAAAAELNIVPCERFDADGLRAYMLADQGFASSNDREAVMLATGGWPNLVDSVVAESQKTTLAAALANLEARLATDDGCEEFVHSAGLYEDTLRQTFAILASIVDDEDSAAPADELASFLTVTDGAAAIAALRYAGALSETSEGHLYPEPVLARRFATVTG